MSNTLLKANILWTLILTYKGSQAFYGTTLKDLPIEGVEPEEVLYIKAGSLNGDMAFFIVFKGERDSIHLMFNHMSTLGRLESFMKKRLTKITWNEGEE